MISKNEIKYIQSLFQKKTRDKEGVFIAEGIKLVNELLQSDIVVRKIYATEEWIAEHKQHPNAIKVQPEELKKISAQSTPNRVLAIVEKKKLATEPLLKNKITLVLDGFRIPETSALLYGLQTGLELIKSLQVLILLIFIIQK